MGASSNSDGFLDLLDRLERSNETVQRRAARSLNEEFKRQMSTTTIGATGRLHASLTTDNKDHIFTLGGGGKVRVGSRDPAARYSADSIPKLRPQPFFAIIAAALFRDARSGSTRAR
jgi:hypothetical protein